MKRMILIVLMIVIALVGLVVVEAASDEDTLKILDGQIELYTSNIETLESNLTKGVSQMENWRAELNQNVGALIAIKKAKNELLNIVKEKENVVDETLPEETDKQETE